MLKQLTALDKLHHKVDSKGFCEDVLHRDDERVFDLQQDELLDFKALHGFMVDDHILSDALHRVDLVILLILNQIYFSESTSAHELQDFEIIKS